MSSLTALLTSYVQTQVFDYVSIFYIYSGNVPKHLILSLVMKVSSKVYWFAVKAMLYVLNVWPIPR